MIPQMTHFNLQVPMFMKDIYRSLTENNGEAGILKNIFEENELDVLKTNPFHITGTDIRVSFFVYKFLIYFLKLRLAWHK